VRASTPAFNSFKCVWAAVSRSGYSVSSRPPDDAAQAGRAFTKRERFGTIGAAELFFDECDALEGRQLLRGRQIVGRGAVSIACRRSPRCLRCSSRKRISESSSLNCASTSGSTGS